MRNPFIFLWLLGAYIIISIGSLSAQTITMPIGGGTIATREWVEQYTFNRLRELGVSDCILQVDSIAQEGPSISFKINSSFTSLLSYQVEIKKGTQSWYYSNIPYQTGERMTLDGVVATGSVVITVSPIGRPSCYASASYFLLGDNGVLACDAGPTILNISNATDTTLTAQFHGSGVSEIRYKILNSSGTQVHTAVVYPTSSVIPLSFPSLIPGGYSLILEGINCTGSSSLGFNVTSPLANCDAGPEILSISSITGTSASVSFHGDNVTSLNWKVKDGSSVLYNTTFNPTSSTFGINYSLGNGTYKLVLSGANCVGSDSADFTVASGGGGDVVLSSGWKFIGRTDTTFLNITVSGSAGNWLISDTSPFTPNVGHEERYRINDVLVKGSKLTNYAYTSNGVLDIKKWVVKTGLSDGMGEWTLAGWSGSDPDGGQRFSPRADVGGQSIIFFEADDNKAGLAWLDRTPTWYRGDHTVSWPTKAPNMTLPAGKYIMYNFRLHGTDQNQRQSKGETFTADHTDISKRVGLVYGSDVLGITNVNASESQFRTWANNTTLYASLAFEWNEGNNYLEHMSIQQKWFTTRLKERFAEDGRSNYILMPDYGGYDYSTNNIWPSPENSVTGNSIRWRYTGTVQDLFNGDGYLGFFQGAINAVNVKHYGTNPKNYGTNLLRIAKINSIKKAGYKAITFGWGMVEIPSYEGWVAGFGWQTKHPSGGVVQRNDLSQIPFDDAVTNGFHSLWYGDGFWCWDGQGMRNADPVTMDSRPSTTLLAGASVLAQNGGSVGNYQAAPDQGLDGYYIGAQLYNQCAETEGGTKFFATFTIGGTTYNAEPDGSDALIAYDQSRGVCSVRVKNGNATIVYYNPFAGNSWQTFSVNIYGSTFTGQVYGKRVYIANVTI